MNAETHGPGVNAPAIEATRDRLHGLLRQPELFQAFAADPKAFLAGHGLTADAELLEMLKARLAGLGSYEDAQRARRPARLAAASNPASANDSPLVDA